MDLIVFSGNVGKDAEYSEKDSRGMAKFSVAVNKKVKGEKVTEWRNVTVFGKTAEFCRDYVKKGRSVLVNGVPSVYAYKNKLEEIVGVMECVANTVELIGGKTEQGAKPDAEGADGPLPF